MMNDVLIKRSHGVKSVSFEGSDSERAFYREDYGATATRASVAIADAMDAREVAAHMIMALLYVATFGAVTLGFFQAIVAH